MVLDFSDFMGKFTSVVVKSEIWRDTNISVSREGVHEAFRELLGIAA